MTQIKRTADILIIGTGPIGATFARILGGQGATIMMIDAGKQLSKRPGQHLKNTYRYQQEPNLFNDAIGSQYETYSVPESIFPVRMKM